MTRVLNSFSGKIWTDTQANYPWRTIQKAVTAVSPEGNIKYRNVHLINY
ncbi:MAG: hypothetical protein LBV71_11115 [Prevotella sp.]|nr:hypothetical protein [Prevotella sp.]